MQRSVYDKQSAKHYQNYQLHRLDGPAVEYFDTPQHNEYWINGFKVTPEEWAIISFTNGIKHNMLFK